MRTSYVSGWVLQVCPEEMRRDIEVATAAVRSIPDVFRRKSCSAPLFCGTDIYRPFMNSHDSYMFTYVYM